ncbi:restriction endonuclease subunit S [Marinobacteraceae bacterium S3BR75-40.1]
MSNWQKLKLPKCLKKSPKAKKLKKKQFLDSGLFPVISQEKETVNGYWNNKDDVVRLDRPVVIFGDHTQVLKLVDFDFVVGADGVKVLKPKSFLDAGYLYYFLLGNPVKELGYARHYRLLKELEIEFPPLPEQKRIVAILDEAFAGIDAAIANTEKNHANARELFESYLNSVFSKECEKFPKSFLGDVCLFENGDRGKNYPKRSEYRSDGIPWINTGHINNDGTLSLDRMNYISYEKYESLRSGKVKSGDLVYCLRGATLGKTALVEPFNKGAVASSLVIIRPKPFLDNRFLYFFLVSPVGKSFIQVFGNGAAQPNLGAKSVAQYQIPLPKLSVQEELVGKLADVAKESQKLEAIYEKKLEALAELKQSLLQKAFSGELTENVAEKEVDEAVA